MSRRRKPHDPASATQAMIQRREREEEKRRLEQMGATVTTDPAGRIVSARRTNVFMLFLARDTITPNQYDAAYRLAEDWAQWKGLDGGPDYEGQKVDGSSGSRELVTDRMINAGKRIWGDGDRTSGVLEHLAEADEAIIVGLMVATVEEDRPMVWRGIVERAVGITIEKRQTEAVVKALEALRAVYEQPAQRRAA